MKDAAGNHIDRTAVERALKRVLASEVFEGADRLRVFLTYVVREAVEGRGAQILGKQIASDVYSLTDDPGGDHAGVVRVDASRLRRRLDLYYAGAGAQDPIRIHIDKGRYAPRFEDMSAAEQSSVQQVSGSLTASGKGVAVPYWILVILVAGAIYGGISAFRSQSPEPVPMASEQTEREIPDLTKVAEREVLFEQATATLKARNAAAEARIMMFPATEPWRVKAAQALYRGAIQLDPGYFGGYAGNAQATAMIAGVAPPGPERERQLDEARSLAARAVQLAPTEAWSQSALAFVHFVERDYEKANSLSLRAVELDPDDLHALEMDAIIALFSGDFERAAANAAPDRHRNREGSRFPWRNALGNTQFHLGEYELAIRYLKEAAALGEPVSEINSAHLIAAHQASGQSDVASELVKGFEATWPNSRVDILLRNIFRNPVDAETVISQMEAAGWEPTRTPD